MNESKFFFVTRPTLASYLLENGCSGKRCVNPYDPERPAWAFEKTDELKKAVQVYQNGEEGNGNGKKVNK